MQKECSLRLPANGPRDRLSARTGCTESLRRARWLQYIFVQETYLHKAVLDLERPEAVVDPLSQRPFVETGFVQQKAVIQRRERSALFLKIENDELRPLV